MAFDLHRSNDDDVEFRVLFEISMTAAAFSSDWGHCDRIATYVARTVSQRRGDALLYANLFSSALNELLETAFRSNAGAGAFACRISRAGAVDRIELTIPGSATVRDFYSEAIEAIRRDDVADLYVAALIADGELDPKIGLLELAVDYGARFSLSDEAGPAVRLVADLVLDQP